MAVLSKPSVSSGPPGARTIAFVDAVAFMFPERALNIATRRTAEDEEVRSSFLILVP